MRPVLIAAPIVAVALVLVALSGRGSAPALFDYNGKRGPGTFVQTIQPGLAKARSRDSTDSTRCAICWEGGRGQSAGLRVRA